MSDHKGPQRPYFPDSALKARLLGNLSSRRLENEEGGSFAPSNQVDRLLESTTSKWKVTQQAGLLDPELSFDSHRPNPKLILGPKIFGLLITLPQIIASSADEKVWSMWHALVGILLWDRRNYYQMEELNTTPGQSPSDSQSPSNPQPNHNSAELRGCIGRLREVFALTNIILFGGAARSHDPD
ncbi:hypothetical protein L207DRAFT_530898 [Hyaloscypha variabilis F]|uniref:Uncharacterized protein n=1 Tax=Hyaloscypha variabilis (strain UAMH 11265 / GT02V1 / F) TaxID=1149755 RepID=A0A2J6RHE1_HYAVF|nr:hypothetical protein L207DRAFT_530898 [Hyaloscypha variabilis F]